MEIQIPFNYAPRSYQLPLLSAIDSGTKRAFIFIHRRGGKDKTCVNIIAKRAIENKGIHYYFLPTATQARKIIWDNHDMMQHFPTQICKLNSTEMKVTFMNGSVVQFIGTDKYDSIRGTNPITCIFSEYAFQDPRVWDIIRPILNENDGIAIFQTTPNGDNHASELYDLAEDNPEWFTMSLDIHKTKRDSPAEKHTKKYGEPVITQADLEEERRMGMEEQMIEQEYYCSRAAGKVGSYWGVQMATAKEQGLISRIPLYPDKRVNIYSDLGVADQTSLWFEQKVNLSHHMINEYSDNGKGIEFYFDYIDNWLLENNLKMGKLHFPHDGKKRDLTSGVSVYSLAMERYGAAHVQIVPIAGKSIQINSARALIPSCAFHDKNCAYGVKCLRNYHKKYDEVRKVFHENPDHDWSSHSADAFQNFAMANKDELKKPKTKVSTTDYSQFASLQKNQF